MSLVGNLKSSHTRNHTTTDVHASDNEECETEAEKKQRLLESAGPPCFYEADIEKYKMKFDKSLQKRDQFKRRMKDKMSFTDLQWNNNIMKHPETTPETADEIGTNPSHGLHRRSKQIYKVAKGTSYSTFTGMKVPEKSPIREL